MKLKTNKLEEKTKKKIRNQNNDQIEKKNIYIYIWLIRIEWWNQKQIKLLKNS